MRVRHQVLPLLFASLTLCVLVLCLGSAMPIWAQSTSTGTVVGTVTDATGAVLNDAAVTLTDTATKSARNATTNDAGRYIFVDVPPGLYDLSISKQGFSTSKTQVTVKVGEQATVNMALQVGGANVVVEVTSVGTELQTMNATVGNTVTAIAIDNLPSLGRDVNTFVELQPAVGTNGAVAGAYQDQSYFSLDGGNNSNDLDGSGSIYTPNAAVGDPTGGVGDQYFGVSGPSGVMPTPQDSVEEFKVNTANQTADFNSSAGAEIKVVTKRGTSAYHGTAYEYYKDNNWSGNTWQNTFEDVPRPSFHYSRFGGAIGGPLMPKRVLDTKTFFFFNYEAYRFPNAETIDRNVPSPALRLGLITDPVTTTIYNLNPTAVTYNGFSYPANNACTGTTCVSSPQDPRNLGINPLVSEIWSKWSPASNVSSCALSFCDNSNVLPFVGTLSLPTSSKFAVVRLDHDFSAKERLMGSWRYFNWKAATDDQVDIGGYFSGDTLGVPSSQSSAPVQDWYLVLGLTSNFTNNVTNDIHYSYLRNWWAWNRLGAPVQTCPDCSGMGGALEIMSGEGSGAAQDLGPYNVNNQQVRNRFWDGQDNMFRDDLSILKGNHLFQLGGTYQRNFDWHQRNDGGGFINVDPVYGLGNGTAGSGLSADIPLCGVQTVSGTNDISNCGALTAAVLGIVSFSNAAYTRSGPNLSLNPPRSPAFDKSTIPYYNFYFSDTWHMKSTFTLSYGLGWTLEMPPTEASGKQIVMVDQASEPISADAYLKARERAALAGQVYNPEIGFALTGNTANGLKYPYNPFYGGFSPRIAAAWNPRFDSDSLAGKIFGHENTVLRGGYGRSYSRLNGVNQVLVPLLGLGLIQQVQCKENLITGCGPGQGDPSTGFRVGPTAMGFDGLNAPLPVPTTTLPQPDFPGYNNTSTATASVGDSFYRPSAVDAFDLTLQRQLSRRISLELGYIGRRITHEFQPITLNTVPYMMTLGGQQFKQAYANVVLQYCGGIQGMAGGGCAANLSAVTPQAFFETALGGATSAYCSTAVGGITPANCTQAVVLNEGSTGTYNLNNQQVFSIWSDLDSGPFIFPRSMMNTPIPSSVSPVYGAGGQTSSGVDMDTALGWGNYNGGFLSVKTADWRGLTAQSNFTWSKALGIGSLYQAVSAYAPFDSFNLSEEYGRQSFDRKFVYNTFLVYQPPFFKGQSGIVGRLLGGWTFASVFTAGSGTPIEFGTTYCCGQEFGSADNINFGANLNAVPITPETHEHAYYNSPSTGLPVNAFKNGVADASNWRNPVLGLDNRDCGSGCISGLPYWNMDFSIKKNVRVAESVSVEVQGVFTNILNHNQWYDAFPGLYNTPAWGSLGGEAGPRNIEVGARVRF